MVFRSTVAAECGDQRHFAVAMYPSIASGLVGRQRTDDDVRFSRSISSWSWS